MERAGGGGKGEIEGERESFNLLKNQTGRFYCRVNGCERKGESGRELEREREEQWKEKKIDETVQNRGRKRKLKKYETEGTVCDVTEQK